MIVVVKIGSSTLSSTDGFVNMPMIASIVERLSSLRRSGYRIVIVTSGAVSVGCQRLRLVDRPADLVTKQAVAAVGQSRLMRIYDDLFNHYDQPIAQVLLSRENISEVHHYRNASNTIHKLLEMGIVPIVNENDTVAVEELQFGDNDNLSALVGSLIQADWLFLLTDVNGLYTADPSQNPDAERIPCISPRQLDELPHIAKVESSAGSWGTGGMVTKIQAARIAIAAGITTCIMHADQHGEIVSIIGGCRDFGTVISSVKKPLSSQRKRWIAHGARLAGAVHLDDGAVIAVLGKASLFAAGVCDVDGDFDKGASVCLYDKYNNEVGRGITNYSSSLIRRIMGKTSQQFRSLVGDNESVEAVVDRGNLALTHLSSDEASTVGVAAKQL